MNITPIEISCECMNENERLKNELAAKDEEIDRLEEIKREYINMQSNVTALRREVSLKQDQHIAQCREYREKIAELRECLKEACRYRCGKCNVGNIATESHFCGNYCDTIKRWHKALEGESNGK